MKFISEKYPDLHIPTIGVRFRDGVAEVTRRGAIAYLSGPHMRRRGVRAATAADEAAFAAAEEQAPAAADGEQDNTGDNTGDTHGQPQPGDNPAASGNTPAAGDNTPDGEQAPAPAPAADMQVPDGTSADVLTWVNGDPARAQAALAAEQTRGNPRITLIRALSKIGS